MSVVKNSDFARVKMYIFFLVMKMKYIRPDEVDMTKIGHVGFFSPGSEILWDKTVDWINKLRYE